jgi:flagellar protein FliS
MNRSMAQASQAYRSASVAVPPLTAMVMLHEGAMTYLQRAITAAEARRFEESHNHMIRATAILRGLSHHLDFDRGGGVAERLYRTYQALIMACLRSFGRRDSTLCYTRIIASIGDLRDSWKYVAQVTAKSPETV